MKATKFFVCIPIVLITFVQMTAWSDSNQTDQPNPWQALQTIERSIPDAGDHPGNIYLEGESVSVIIPDSAPEDIHSWQILNDKGELIRSGKIDEKTLKTIHIGNMEIGWYRVEFLDQDKNILAWTTAAVLVKLQAPTPQDSPICIDGAHAWFAKDDPETQKQLSRLATLAGVNWIRDRLRWREIQPQENIFAEQTTYDSSADIQHRFGLKTLQVFHDTPPWAVGENASRGRFSNDLRHVYRFCKTMAKRFQGRVQAWEPWNEANVDDFGGHTVDEMCSYQKAAYLGFKAGDPNVTVGWNAYAAVPTELHTQGVLHNESWPYFDTYNIHTYDWPHSYKTLWKPALEAACGRSLWITESDRGIQYQENSPTYDLSKKDEILKAEFMAQSYASSLFSGANRHFHFILGHYTESRNNVQFGLLRHDLTPRPAYVALAALGRFLAGGQCLGRFNVEKNPNAHFYAFKAEPDGETKDVIVAWAEKQVDWSNRGKLSIDWPVPKELKIEQIYDYLGRKINRKDLNTLTSAPIFLVLPPGESSKLDLEKPVKNSVFRKGNPSPVVFQCVLPASTCIRLEERHWAIEHEHLVEAGKEIELPVYAYNFSDRKVKGSVSLDHAPNDWKISQKTWKISMTPLERKRLPLRVLIPKREFSKTSDNWIRLRGEFENAGKPVLAFRLITKAGEGYNNLDPFNH